MCVQVDIHDMTESLWVQVTPCSDHMCWRQATLPPGNVGHDVHWREREWVTIRELYNEPAVSRRRVCCCYRPGCDAISITALGLRRARLGIIPLYKSTLVCTTVTYDCSLLHAFAVTTTTLEPAEAEISSTATTMVINSCGPVTAKLVKEKHKA